MSRIEEVIEIAAAPMTVFRLCHDLERRAAWDERVVGAEMITPAPVRRGSLIRIDAGRGGQYQFTWEAEYTDYQLPAGSTLKVIDAAPSSPFKAGTEIWKFDHTGGGTRVTFTWVYEPSGIIARIADALGRRRATHGAIRRSLSNLKRLAEAG